MTRVSAEAKREPLWDVQQAAQYLGVSISWVYRKSGAGELPCRKLGSKTRFVPSELETWVASQPGQVT